MRLVEAGFLKRCFFGFAVGGDLGLSDTGLRATGYIAIEDMRGKLDPGDGACQPWWMDTRYGAMNERVVECLTRQAARE